MHGPDPADVNSRFVVLEDDYDAPEYYGGAFEGSHTYAGVVVFHLYSIVRTDEGDRLRIETRHHGDGRVLAHDREERRLTEDMTVGETGTEIEPFCRRHHHDRAREEVRSVLEHLDDGPV